MSAWEQVSTDITDISGSKTTDVIVSLEVQVMSAALPNILDHS